VAFIATFGRKLHQAAIWDLVTGFEEPDALGAVGAVAVGDVAGQRPGET
jgi:hypothetical protein